MTEPPSERAKPGFVQRLFLKSVPPLYYGPLALLFRWRCVMIMTTTGRKSGLPRTNGVSFMPVDGHYVAFSGWGTQSQWYRNLRAKPEATIKVGRERMHVTARFVEESERRRELMLRMRDRSSSCGPPVGVRQILALMRLFDYEDEIRRAVEYAEELPVIELIPRGGP